MQIEHILTLAFFLCGAFQLFVKQITSSLLSPEEYNHRASIYHYVAYEAVPLHYTRRTDFSKKPLSNEIDKQVLRQCFFQAT